MDDEVQAPGWDAIDAALKPIYGDAEPAGHWGTIVRYSMGGEDPCDGVSAYRRDEPVPHWHYITYGMTELYEKESDDPEYSGWGLEFTYRLARAPEDGDTPPTWPLTLLNGMARYIIDSGNLLQPGHYIDLNGPPGPVESDLTSAAFVHDPELPPIQTPNGKVEFLQLVGITDDEQAAMRRWKTSKVLELMADRLPLFVTDLRRKSLMADPDINARVADGARTEGSWTGSLGIEVLQVAKTGGLFGGSGVKLTLGAGVIEDFLSVLPGRLFFDRDYVLVGRPIRARMTRGAAFSARQDGQDWDLVLTDEIVRELIAVVRPKAGLYKLPSEKRFMVEVVPTRIRDTDGTVVRTIG
jgi:suppressor of fused-like protein